MSIQNSDPISDKLTAITGIKWRMSEDGQTYQMAPIDMHKVLVLYTAFQDMGIAHSGETDAIGHIIVKLSPESAAKLINNPEQSAGLAEQLITAGRPANTRGV